jgi:hypothetical protein
MTQTRSEASPAPTIGQAIGQAVGQAQTVLSRLLTGVLAETGTSRETYLALQRLSAHGDAANREIYVRDLSVFLDLDLWAAGELANGMVAAGLVRLDDNAIVLSAPGAELRARVGDSVGAVSAPLWAALDLADLETTVRTLGEIAVLARRALAAG